MSATGVLRTVQRSDPIVRDAVLAALLLAAFLVDSVVTAHKELTVVGVLAALAATLPLTFRSRAPLLVAGVLTVALVGALVTLKPEHVISLPVCCAFYTVAAHGERRRSVVVAVVGVAAALAVVVAFSPSVERWPNVARNVGGLLAALAIGDAVRWRRAYRAAIEERVDQAVSGERLRIARDLHDSIAHGITAINVQSGAAAHLALRDPDAARTALLDIRAVSGDMLRDLRGTLGLLRVDDGAAPTRPVPSIDGLDEIVERVRGAGVEVTLTRDGPAARLPTAVDVAAHRIVQEALTNVLRHSHADAVAITIRTTGTCVSVDVLDDGRGADPAHPPTAAGFGVVGMRERATAVGGRFDAGPSPDGGWRVHAELPWGPG